MKIRRPTLTRSCLGVVGVPVRSRSVEWRERMLTGQKRGGLCSDWNRWKSHQCHVSSGPRPSLQMESRHILPFNNHLPAFWNDALRPQDAHECHSTHDWICCPGSWKLWRVSQRSSASQSFPQKNFSAHGAKTRRPPTVRKIDVDPNINSRLESTVERPEGKRVGGLESAKSTRRSSLDLPAQRAESVKC